MPRPQPSGTEEEGLIARAVRGDRRAFGHLYERYVTRVYGHTYRLTGDPELAEDITAQAFLKALEAIHRYEARGIPFLAWLLRIAHNLALNAGRENRRDALAARPLGDALPLPTAPAEEGRKTSARGERAWQMVGRLRENQRQVILMRFAEGLSYQDVAHVLGKSVRAVRVIQFRALTNLRRLLQEEDLAARKARSP